MLDCQTSSAERSKFRSYHYNARWYDAGTGRFISEDPARDGSNWYIYCSNNPIKYIDPTGMWDSSGPANKNPYDDDGDASRDDNTNSPRGSGDDSGGSKESKPEDKEKPITTPVIGPPPEITPGIGVPESAEKILTDLGIGEDLGESSIPVTGGTSGGSSGDGSTTPPTEEPLDGSNELPPKPEGTDGDSGWSAYAGAEMIGLGALIAGTGNIPMAIAGGIAIVAGSELARTGNINNTTETIYEFSKFISNKMNPGRKGQR